MPVILLIEALPELASIIIAGLRQNGYEVEHALDGKDGLHLQAANPPQMIILDCLLPDADGLQVLLQLRQAAVTPVLMLTAPGDEMEGIMGLEIEADDYLSKPFDMSDLLSRVQTLLHRIEAARTAAEHSRLTCGPLELESGTYRALLYGNPVNLARAEFELIHLMVSNPGRVFTRAYLTEMIWDDHYVPGGRSIDNLVLRLRKKLGSFGNQIEAVWGEGYRLLPPETDRQTVTITRQP
jgi:DNA-binding response OmpR family regulator